MNLNQLNPALKMIQQDYKLTPLQLETLSRRLMADEREFERMWALYNRRRTGKEDIFLDTLLELLSN